MNFNDFWWVSENGKVCELAQVREVEGKTELRPLWATHFWQITAHWHLIRKAKTTENSCEKCKFFITPNGKQCYTLTRMLNEKISRILTPSTMIPAMIEIENECQRYKLKQGK